ncbi:alpha/beta fold hydrolase [Rhodococcus opacus]|jgi:pimeloyl-ACP methyl ester carboxylesterase|uniref:alpha/beta fold hydrolase n=1 Tax=Rhodococcus opacus TaxID=37919 RepID=UPI0024748C69|nr:alpha/beta hydrolase [Rhodococcus opacus]MDH6291179.1 pimeloyl-ACP methyl ester carboxylesterase [Rhodococcus opacus]
MPSDSRPCVAVVLPGTGSDADFVARAFTEPLTCRGVRTAAVEPDPRRVVGSYVDALDAAAAQHGRILVGGVSIGAAVALQWAGSHPDHVAGVLAALPAWTGTAADAPAAASARYTAARLRADGLEQVTAEMIASSPPWLGRELAKSWRSQWPHLPAALDEASEYHAPGAGDLERITVPVGIAAATDDAVHPLEVAREWSERLPHAGLVTVTLDEIGADPAILGYASLDALDSVLHTT